MNTLLLASAVFTLSLPGFAQTMSEFAYQKIANDLKKTIGTERYAGKSLKDETCHTFAGINAQGEAFVKIVNRDKKAHELRFSAETIDPKKPIVKESFAAGEQLFISLTEKVRGKVQRQELYLHINQHRSLTSVSMKKDGQFYKCDDLYFSEI